MDDSERTPSPEPEDRREGAASPLLKEVDALREQVRILEKKLASQGHTLNVIKLRQAQQDAHMRDVSRQVRNIVTSKIWETLVYGGGLILAGQRLVERLRSEWRRPRQQRSEAVELHCEYPPASGVRTFNKLLVQGWTAAESGVDIVEASVASNGWVQAKSRIYRQDVSRQFPSFVSAGFRLEIDISGLPVGEHRLLIRARSHQGSIAQIERVITVDANASPKTLTLEESSAALELLRNRPLFSFIIPVYNVAEVWLRRCLDSVLRQRYPDWEMCIANDASSEPHIRPVLEEYRQKDRRVKVVHCAERGHIALASNAALELATGDFIALLDHDDEVAEDALLEIARALDQEPDADMVYTDEDKIDEHNIQSDPFFKPDWSPEYFLTCMYSCHLGIYRTGLVRASGGFRSEMNGAQDYDLALRMISSNRVLHVPKVLYHWRTLAGSTASGADAKSYAYPAAQRAIEHYLRSNRIEAEVLPGPREGFHRVLYPIHGKPRVSIVIPTAGRMAMVRGRKIDLIHNCVASIVEKSEWDNLEVIVVENGDLTGDQRDFLRSKDVRLVTYEASMFNLSDKINLGCFEAAGEHLLILNDDIEVITGDWIESLLQYSQNPEIGAVGAKLMFADGRIQHAGVVILSGCPAHPYYKHPPEEIGYYLSVQLPRNYLAVTGACMMTRAAVFRDLNGFDSAFPLNYNDVDYCLRVHQRGLRMVYTPYAELYHHESQSKEGPGRVSHEELERFQARWMDRYYQDPYYNPNLPTDYPYYRLG